MPTITSVGNGGWNTAGTWDAGVPADGDTVVIHHAIVFDVDQSAFSTGVGVTINSGGSLTASTSAGSYYLKCKANLVVNSGGSLNVGSSGTAYPSNCTMVFAFAGAFRLQGAGQIRLYCTEPTHPTCLMTAAYSAAGDDHIHVDLPTADQDGWVVGATVRIDDLTYTDATSSQIGVISGIADNLITIATTKPANDKASGSRVILVTRNVRVTGATGYAFVSCTDLILRAEVSGCTNGINTSAGAQVIGGTITGVARGFNNSTGAVLSGGVIAATSIGAFYGCTTPEMSGGVVSSSPAAFSACVSPTQSGGEVSSCTNAHATNTTSTTISGGTIRNCTYQILQCNGLTISAGTFSTSTSCARYCNGVTISGGTFSTTTVLDVCASILVTGGTFSGATTGASGCMDLAMVGGTFSSCTTAISGCMCVYLDGVTFTGCTTDIAASYGVEAHNCALGGTTEVVGYNAATILPTWFMPSFDHDASAGAFKSWSKGGITLKQTTDKPTGYSWAYQTTLESASYWGFYQERQTVGPGETIRYVVYVLQSVTGMTAAPKAELVAADSDPLLGGTALATAAHSNANNATFEALQLTWQNTAAVPRAVMLRVSGKNASGTITARPVHVLRSESW